MVLSPFLPADARSVLVKTMIHPASFSALEPSALMIMRRLVLWEHTMPACLWEPGWREGSMPQHYVLIVALLLSHAIAVVVCWTCLKLMSLKGDRFLSFCAISGVFLLFIAT